MSSSVPTSWDVDGKAPEAPELGYLGDRQLISLADSGGGGSSTLSPLAMVPHARCMPCPENPAPDP